MIQPRKDRSGNSRSGFTLIELLVVIAIIALLAALSLGVVVGLFALRPLAPGMWIAAGLLAGGALGNLADRARTGSVVDYIDLGPWPVFNLADIAITLGIVLLVFSALREAKEQPEAAEVEEAPGTE